MQKKAIKFSLYLIFFSFLGKILSFVSRILLARNIDAQAMSYYTIISPTIVILVSLVQMGIPGVLSKMVADKNYQFKILSTSIYITITTTTLTTILYLFLIPFLSALLFRENIKSLFYSVLPFLPLVALSGLLRGYLMGKQKFISASFSQVIEETSRIIFLLLSFLYIPSLTSLSAARNAILSISIAEGASALFMLLVIYFHHKKIFKSLSYSKTSMKNILSIALPMSGSRFIGSLSYFIEPMIMCIPLNMLQSKSMMIAYGTINGYVLPLLTMPSFIAITLANYLLPSFTYHYSRNNKKQAKKLFLEITLICLFIGTAYSLFLYAFSKPLCLFFYHSTTGADMLKTCTLPFALYSLQPVFGIMLHALNKSKESTFDTLIGCIVRLSIVYLFSKFLLSDALLFGLCAGMLTTTLLHAWHLIRYKKSSL